MDASRGSNSWVSESVRYAPRGVVVADMSERGVLELEVEVLDYRQFAFLVRLTG